MGASDQLISFLSSYTGLIEHQLSCVKETLDAAIGGVVEGVNKISEATRDNRQKMEAILEEAYVHPDGETLASIYSIQDLATSIFEKAERGEGTVSDVGNEVSLECSDSSIELLSSKFGRKFAAFIGGLDENIKENLFKITGHLSADDIMAQRIEHITMKLNALQSSINYLLLDYEARGSEDEINRLIVGLKTYAKNLYTMEEEKLEFDRFFP